MNFSFPHEKKLLFQFEVLQARLAIRELFLKTTVREVYENIGQVLSLVRLQLNFLIPEETEIVAEHLNEPGDLVGQSLRDLRHMCRSFYPDLDIQKEGGFIEGIENNLKILGHHVNCKISVEGVTQKMSEGLDLIVFKIIQDLLIDIKHAEGKLKGINLLYVKNILNVEVHYKGKDLEWKNVGLDFPTDEHMSLQDRIDLIDGKFKIEKRRYSNIHIHITSPLNFMPNE